MAFWNRKTEERSAEQRNAESPSTHLTYAAIIAAADGGTGASAGVNVTLENALSIPAVWAAVNFLSGTMAGLPLHVYDKTASGREKTTDPIGDLFHFAVSDECSSFEWRKYVFERVLTSGRGLTYIQRDGRGKVTNLYPLNPSKATVKRIKGEKVYVYKDGGTPITYAASDVIDIPFMLDADMLKAYSPILKNKDTIGLGIAATRYGSRLFANGGVPPFVMTGNFQTGTAMNRASNDLEQAVKDASATGRLAITIPSSHEIKPIGMDPEKSQLVELKRFVVEEVARIYSLPPTFLQDLSKGTFSNTEQQDLHFVKHTIKRWAEQVEQEINLKVFGRGNNDRYVEFNLDGLLRGDFKTRMEGYASGVQNGILKPNEARRLENRPDDPEGDKLMIQGATVPLGSQPLPGATNET